MCQHWCYILVHSVQLCWEVFKILWKSNFIVRSCSHFLIGGKWLILASCTILTENVLWMCYLLLDTIFRVSCKVIQHIKMSSWYWFVEQLSVWKHTKFLVYSLMHQGDITVWNSLWQWSPTLVLKSYCPADFTSIPAPTQENQIHFSYQVFAELKGKTDNFSEFQEMTALSIFRKKGPPQQWIITWKLPYRRR